MVLKICNANEFHKRFGIRDNLGGAYMKRFRKVANLTTDKWDIIDEEESEKISGFVVYNDLGSLYFSSAPQICDLLNDLNDEKNSWKMHCCKQMNVDSVLSMDCQIVQEAIWDLEKAINDNKNNTYNEKQSVMWCLDDLKKKWDKLNRHRLDGICDDFEYWDGL